MIRKRSPAAAKAVQASADDLPLDDESFDASMADLTVQLPPCFRKAIAPVRSEPSQISLWQGRGPNRHERGG